MAHHSLRSSGCSCIHHWMQRFWSRWIILECNQDLFKMAEMSPLYSFFSACTFSVYLHGRYVALSVQRFSAMLSPPKKTMGVFTGPASRTKPRVRWVECRKQSISGYMCAPDFQPWTIYYKVLRKRKWVILCRLYAMTWMDTGYNGYNI